MTVKPPRQPAGSAPAAATDDGRGEGQKRRTRAALLAAAARLMAEGQTPSVAEVADAADVSRRTAYRYFPTQDQLLVEASLEQLRPEVEAAIASAHSLETDAPDDLAEALARLDATVSVMHRLAVEHEPLLRTMIRLTAGRSHEGIPTRGYRRIEWLTAAIAPIKTRLGRARFDRLVSALSSCVGMDSLFLLQDTRGLSAAAAEKVTRWTARALVHASMREAEGEE